MENPNGQEPIVDELFEDVLHTELTDEAYEELAVSEGAVVVGLSFWESSVADELEEDPPVPEHNMAETAFLGVEPNTLFELFGASLFPADQNTPLVGVEAIEKALVDMADSESELSEVAQTEDGALALVFAAGEDLKLIITVGAWSVSEWDELPED